MPNPFKAVPGAAFPPGHVFGPRLASVTPVGPVAVAERVDGVARERVSRERTLTAAHVALGGAGGMGGGAAAAAAAGTLETCSKRGRSLFASARPDSVLSDEDSSSEDEAMRPSVATLTGEVHSMSSPTPRDGVRRRVGSSTPLTMAEISGTPTETSFAPTGMGEASTRIIVPSHMRFVVSSEAEGSSRAPGRRGGVPAAAVAAMAAAPQVRIAPLMASPEALDEIGDLLGKITIKE